MEQEPQDKSYEEILAQINLLIKANNQEKIKGFINARLSYLKQHIIKRLEVSALSNQPVEGFIAETTEIKRNMMVNGFVLNDEQVYPMIFEEINLIKTQNQFKNIGLKIMMPQVIYQVISKYFGNFFGNSGIERSNQEFYLDRSTSDSPNISLVELKRKGFSVCAERAALAQNLLSFVGLDSTLIIGKLQLVDGQITNSLHIFNVVKSPKGFFIIETTNPSFIFDNGGKIVAAGPAIYPISESDFIALKTGGSVEITHHNFRQIEDGTCYPEEEKRIYSGTKTYS